MIFLDSSVFDKPNNSSVTKGALSVLLYIIVVICLVGKALIKDYYSMLFCVLTLTLFIATAFTKKLFKIYITPFISSLILLFIFSAEILGEMCHLYTRISYWDAILHFTSGILFGAIGVSLFNRLNKTDILKTNLSPAVLVITIIGFSVFVGVLWEFFEFACDNWLKTDMQKDSFIDSIYSVALNQSEKNQTTRL